MACKVGLLDGYAAGPLMLSSQELGQQTTLKQMQAASWWK
jgi:hypothetical protein